MVNTMIMERHKVLETQMLVAINLDKMNFLIMLIINILFMKNGMVETSSTDYLIG